MINKGMELLDWHPVAVSVLGEIYAVTENICEAVKGYKNISFLGKHPLCDRYSCLCLYINGTKELHS